MSNDCVHVSMSLSSSHEYSRYHYMLRVFSIQNSDERIFYFCNFQQFAFANLLFKHYSMGVTCNVTTHTHEISQKITCTQQQQVLFITLKRLKNRIALL